MTRFTLRSLLAALTLTVGVAQALAQAQTLSVAAGNAVPVATDRVKDVASIGGVRCQLSCQARGPWQSASTHCTERAHRR